MLAATFIGALGACEGPRVPAGSEERALAARLTGVWDVELTLDRKPLGAPARSGDADGPHARGRLTLLESARGEGGPFLTRPATHTGVYDLDLAAFGVPLANRSPVPSLVAVSSAPDSLIAVLPAGSQEAVLVLRGTMVSDTVRGDWSYGGGRAVGGWGGRFVLSRH